MEPEYGQMMARYNRLMNERLYALSAELSDELRKADRGAFFGSIHRTFNHILVGDRVWLGRLEGVTLGDGEMGPGGIVALDQELHQDFDALRRARAETDDALDAFMASLTAERLASPLRYVRRGAPRELPLWQVITHVFNHQTHHRGQITTLLSQAGLDPGVTDLIAML